MFSTGGFYTCALKEDGIVWCWGRNFVAQLGDGTTQDKSTPFHVQWLKFWGTQVIELLVFKTIMITSEQPVH